MEKRSMLVDNGNNKAFRNQQTEIDIPALGPNKNSIG
jgi:hypothetical protein